MLGRCLGLILFCSLSLSASAVTNSAIMSNLEARLHSLTQGGSLIKSFPEHSQSYIYDQALAIIAFSKNGNQKQAKLLLSALDKLQNKDGSLYFSYYLDGKSPYPVEGDKRFAGAIAWVALAAITYQQQFKSREFYQFNASVLSYLASQIRPVKINGHSVKAISFAPTDISATIWNENDVAALEHNLDAYSAFLHFSQINKDEKSQKIAADLKKFILTMWDDSRSHFWSGANLKTGVINKQELYLDNQTWSLLALDSETIKSLNAKEALVLNCENFLVEHDGVLGFMDTKPTNRPSPYQFVWSEGSAGQILAMNSLSKMQKEKFQCQDISSQAFLENIKKMQKKDGGIAYATSSNNPDFTTSSSVAGTTWYYFAANSINPFKL